MHLCDLLARQTEPRHITTLPRKLKACHSVAVRARRAALTRRTADRAPGCLSAHRHGLPCRQSTLARVLYSKWPSCLTSEPSAKSTTKTEKIQGIPVKIHRLRPWLLLCSFEGMVRGCHVLQGCVYSVDCKSDKPHVKTDNAKL